MNPVLRQLSRARHRRAWRRRLRAGTWILLGLLGYWSLAGLGRLAESPAAVPPSPSVPVQTPLLSESEPIRQPSATGPVDGRHSPPSVLPPLLRFAKQSGGGAGAAPPKADPPVAGAEASPPAPPVADVYQIPDGASGSPLRFRIAHPRLPSRSAPLFSSSPPQSSLSGEPGTAPEAPARIEDFVIRGILELTLPEAVQVFNQRLEKAMDLIDEERLTREYSEDELNQILLGPLQARYAQQLGPLTAQIHPDGFWISGTVRVGRGYIPLEIRMGVEVFRGRIHLALNEFAVNGRPLPSAMREDLERRVNDLIDQERTSIRIRDFVLGEGSARIALDLS